MKTILFLLLASTVVAGESPLQIAVLCGNAADLATTRSRLSNQREWNPLLGQSFGQEVAVKAGMTSLEMWGVHRLWSRGHRHEATVAAIGLTAINGLVVGINLSRRSRR